MTTDTTPAAIEALLKDVTLGPCVASNNPGDWGLGGNWTVSVAPHDYDAIIAEIPYQTPYFLGEKLSVRDRASAARANSRFIAWCFSNVPTLAAERDAAIRDRDAGAKDYCALMERHDAEFVRAEKTEAEAAALRGEVARLKAERPFIVGANNGYETAMEQVAAEARRYAGHYEESSDGRNTFTLFAEWADRAALTSKGGE